MNVESLVHEFSGPDGDTPTGALVEGPNGEAWGTTGIVIANASCNFKRPINYPGTVEVKLLVGPPGGSSVPTFYELLVGNDLYADGAATVVFIDMEKQKPIRIPQNIREALQ